jgi:hypothetical protein
MKKNLLNNIYMTSLHFTCRICVGMFMAVFTAVDFKPLAPHCCVNPNRDFGFFHVRKLSI